MCMCVYIYIYIYIYIRNKQIYIEYQNASLDFVLHNIDKSIRQK